MPVHECTVNTPILVEHLLAKKGFANRDMFYFRRRFDSFGSDLHNAIPGSDMNFLATAYSLKISQSRKTLGISEFVKSFYEWHMQSKLSDSLCQLAMHCNKRPLKK